MELQDKDLIVAVSPHLRSGDSVKREMWDVVIALVPALIASYLFFGRNAIVITLTAVLSCMFFEVLAQKVMRRKVTLLDGSAIITGILLAFNLPPRLPLWLVILGSAVAIILGKQAFGGLGHNIFNPALVGRVFLLAAYPTYMTTWSPTLFNKVDTATYATPLAVVKEHPGGYLPTYWDLFIGNVGGCIGETSALALLIGGLYLLYRRVIIWHIPVSYIGTVFIISLLFGKDPVFHLLAGGLMLGALFMATDLVTSPTTPGGMIIFGIGCGVLTMVIRLFGKYPEGVSYSILFMNAWVPLIERYTQPRRFGTK